MKFSSSGRIQVNGNEITLSIKSEPRHGKANNEMVRKISQFFGVPENNINIISGLTSRKKIIEIQNIWRINTPGFFDQLNYKLSQDVTVGSKLLDSSSNSEIETPNPHKLNLGSITPQIQTPGGTAALGTASFFPILAGLA